MTAFANKSPRELMDEMRRLLNIAYSLGLEEAKEIARGKYLKVLQRPDNSWHEDGFESFFLCRLFFTFCFVTDYQPTVSTK